MMNGWSSANDDSLLSKLAAGLWEVMESAKRVLSISLLKQENSRCEVHGVSHIIESLTDPHTYDFNALVSIFRVERFGKETNTRRGFLSVTSTLRSYGSSQTIFHTPSSNQTAPELPMLQSFPMLLT